MNICKKWAIANRSFYRAVLLSGLFTVSSFAINVSAETQAAESGEVIKNLAAVVNASADANIADDQAAGTAHEVVESITVDLLALIQGAQEYIDEDEDRFFTELESLLRPFVDFRSFARAVMGKHASSKKMSALDDAGREQLNAQIDRFSEVFSAALIKTYGKGLLAFEGERIEVVPASADAEVSSSKASVKQLIYGERQEPYKIFYSMRKNKSDEWKLRNMVVESINLGKIYRNQFDNAYQVYGGDIDRVIENWVVTGDTQVASSDSE